MLSIAQINAEQTAINQNPRGKTSQYGSHADRCVLGNGVQKITCAELIRATGAKHLRKLYELSIISHI